MTKAQKTDDPSMQKILKQAELVALDVARAEAIVDHALEAAAMAMAARGTVGTSEMTEYARQLLQIASGSAKKVLQVAKKEAQITLELASSLAKERRAEEDLRLAASVPLSVPK
jgi:antitoxin component HigA of HigAB toxin-antitoxin module